MTEVEIAQDDEVILIQADDAPSIVVMLDSETDVIQTLDVGPPGPQGEPGPAGPPSTVPGPAGPPGPAGVGIAGSAMPLMDGAAAIGVSAAWAHEDHRHPTDTSRAPLGSPTFIGVPAAPTAPPGTTTTQLATTAFVGAALTAAAVPAPATAPPVMDGVAAVGAATKYAREDHVHPSNTAKEDKANKGIALGYASLDASAKVPAAQLPAYVDDVLEFANVAAFPATGATGLIYVALDTNKIYRWSGSAYIEISPSPGSTDSVPEGSVNLYYTNARASAAAPVQSVAGRGGVVVLTKADVGLANVDNTSDLNKPVSTATQTALNLKADLASPTFTGDPKAPTPTAGDNDTSIATTAFVAAALTAGVVPATAAPVMDGVAAVGIATKYAREDHKHPTDTSLAPLASPAFTGNPTAPTPTAGDNDTSIATTAFVAAAMTAAGSVNPSNALPAMDGVAAAGASALYSRGDHVHPTDTSRAPLASPTFTGVPAAPTAAPATNTTQLATTAFVGAAVTAAVVPATVAPLMNGVAAVGVATKYAREDHVHASDTSRVAKSGDTMSGSLSIGGQLVVSNLGADFTGKVWHRGNNAGDWGSLFTAPGYGLLVQAGTGTGDVSFQVNNAANSATYFSVRGDGYAQFWGNVQAYSYIRAAGYMWTDQQGYKPGGGSWADTSDARIKTVAGDYTHGLAEILKLSPRRYTYKGNDTPDPPSNSSGEPPVDPTQTAKEDKSAPVVPYKNSGHYQAAIDSKEFIGLIAQEAETVMPEMVTQRSGYIDGVAVTDMRELDTTPLIFALVNAVNELAARVVALEGAAKGRP